MSIAGRSSLARGLKAFFHPRQLLCAASVASTNLLALARPEQSSSPASFPIRNTAANFSSSSAGEDSENKSVLYVLGVLSELASRLEAPTLLRSSQQTLDIESDEATRSLSLEELALQLCQEYPKLPPLTFPSEGEEGRKVILEYLAMKCSPSNEQVSSAVKHYQVHAPTENSASYRHLQMQLMSKLREACTPLYETMFQCLLEEEGKQGMVFLVHLRKDLREWIRWRNLLHDHDDELMMHMKQLDSYLRDLLSTWFSPGMLEIRRITYDGTSAAIMEKIATKEAVHPIRSLDDLRQRLGPDRRVFAVFHPLLPDEPLVFVHVALRSYIPKSLDQVMETDLDETPLVATFYSITAAEAGLGGVNLGNHLIKSAVKLLRAEFPQLESIVTLSPIPRFRKWLAEKLAHNQGKFQDDTLLSSDETEHLQSVLGCVRAEDVPKMLLQTLEENPEIEERFALDLEPILLKLAARYLVVEKHHGKPLDGVARFHIGNGAEMYRLNFMADTSRKGFHNSFGLMVNYRYNSEHLEENQARYEKEYWIPVCEGVSRWLSKENL